MFSAPFKGCALRAVRWTWRLVGLVACVLGVVAPWASAAPPEVVVNRVVLSAQQRQLLTQRLGSPLLPGRFWYDARAGLWGREGGPGIGRLPAGLPVPAPMPADASGRGTGVFTNGRELHPLEVATLRALYGRVIPGRYWLDAQGRAGFEGGPAAWNLYGASASRSRVGGHSWRGGSVIGGGGTTGFIGTDGSSVICSGGSCTFN